MLGWTEEGNGRRGEVLGSNGETYHCDVALDDGGLRSTCDCPAWDKYGPHCKHVVALGLADRARAPVEVPRQAEVVPLPSLAKLESWLGLSAAGEPSFMYRLAPAQPRAAGRSWLFDVRRRDGKDGGPVAVKRFLSTGTRLAPADERVFTELARQESRFDGKFVLTDDDVAELLPLLTSRRVVYRGTPLRFSAQPARPQIHLASTPEGARARIEFQLPDGRTTGFDTSMLLIGRRSASLLDGQDAYPLEPDLPPRLWRAWLREPSMSFPAAQVERALSFFAAHLPGIDLRLRADGLDVVEDVTPALLLSLEGSAEQVKAQLAARYGSATVPVAPGGTHLGYAASPGAKGRTLFRPPGSRGARGRPAAGGPRLQVRPDHRHLPGHWRRGGQLLVLRARRAARNLGTLRRPATARQGAPAAPAPGAGEHRWQRLVRAGRPLRGRRAAGGPRRGAAVAEVRPSLHPPRRRELRRGRPGGDLPGRQSPRGGRSAARLPDHPPPAVPGRGARCAGRPRGRGPLRGQGPRGNHRAPRAEPRPAGRPSGGAGGHAPPLPGGWPRLAVVPPPPRLGRHPRRRHGPRQDGAGPRPAAAGRATPRASHPSLVVAPTSVRHQLGARGGALRPRAPRRGVARAGPRGANGRTSPACDVVITTYALRPARRGAAEARWRYARSSTRRRTSRTRRGQAARPRSAATPTIGSRSPARRSRTASASCGASSTS